MRALELIDTELDFYLKDADQFHCLRCTLIECRQDDEGCFYRNTAGHRREKNRDYQMRSRDRRKLTTAIEKMRRKYDGRRKRNESKTTTGV
jgi:hypothetical protein